MDNLQEIRVNNLAGNLISTFTVDLNQTTGWDLKKMIAQTSGFPAVGMQLRQSEVVLTNAEYLGSVISPSAIADGCITVMCLLAPARPCGPKDQGVRQTPFGSKRGMLLTRNMERAEASGKSMVARIKNPQDAQPELRNLAQKLITISFAPGLAPLIQMACEAACQVASAENVTSDAGIGGVPYLYEHEGGAYADLSSCRMWMSTFRDDVESVMSRHESRALVCAVVWRLLPNWTGAPGMQGGPVLEVLFLATNPEYRESGEAMRLVQELESSAKAMGCIALAVAAVPKQGISFWHKCGYTEAVPLNSKVDPDNAGIDPKEPGLGEPLTPLGVFLNENMLLFTDSPLVVKTLTGTEIVDHS
jgi:GNAT superfamily N-acetyltransferase